MHAQAIYFHEFACDRGGQSLVFSDIFSEIDISLKQVSHCEIKLVPLFSTVTLFLYDYVC